MSPSGDSNDQELRRERALRRLPVAYASALRLRRDGLSREAIARRLSIEPEALGPLFDMAEAKLAAIINADSEAELGQ